MKRSRVFATLIVCILIVLIFFGLYETSTNWLASKRLLIQFSSQDNFAIAESNGNINFAENGTYENAILTKSSGSPTLAPFGYWTFQGLSLNKMSPGHLDFSAQNCNVTIANYYEDSDGNSISGKIDYLIVGSGTQALILYEPVISLTVQIDGVQRAENDGWKNIEGHYVLVTGTKSSANIQYSLRFPPAA